MKEARIKKPALQNRFVLKPSTAKSQGANVPFYVVQVRSWTSSNSLVWIWLIDELYWRQWDCWNWTPSWCRIVSHAGCVLASFPQRFSHWSSGVGCIIIMVYCYHLKYLGFPWGKMAGSMEAVVSVGSYCTCSSGILPALQPCCHHVLLPPHLTAMRFLPSSLQRSGTSESVLNCAQSPNTFCLLWNKWLGVFAEWPWNEHVGFGLSDFMLWEMDFFWGVQKALAGVSAPGVPWTTFHSQWSGGSAAAVFSVASSGLLVVLNGWNWKSNLRPRIDLNGLNTSKASRPNQAVTIHVSSYVDVSGFSHLSVLDLTARLEVIKILNCQGMEHPGEGH